MTPSTEGWRPRGGLVPLRVIVASAALLLNRLRRFLLPSALASAAACVLAFTFSAGAATSIGVHCTLKVFAADGVTLIPANAVLTSPVTLVLRADITKDDGTPLADGDVSFWNDITGAQVAGTSDGLQRNGSTGSMTQTSSLVAGNYALYASYNGSDETLCASDPQPFSVGPPETLKTTSIALVRLSGSLDAPVASLRIPYGAPVDLIAHVTQTSTGALPPPGQLRFFDEQEALGQPLVLGSDGTAELDNVGPFAPGVHTIEAHYQGDLGTVDDTPIAATVHVHATTSISVRLGMSGGVGNSVALSATLTDQRGQTVVGRHLTLTAGSSTPCTTPATDSSGTASCNVTLVGPPGGQNVTASFTGDDTYDASTGTGTISVTRGTTSLAVPNVHAVTQHTAILSATLRNAAGPITGQPVALSVKEHPSEHCAQIPVTDSQGIASCPVLITDGAGNYTVHASFAQTTDYYDTWAEGAMDVRATVPTALDFVGPTTDVAAGAVTDVTFVLTDTMTHLPIGNQKGVTITFNGLPQDVTTLSDGSATWHGAAQPFGGDPIATASFAAAGFDSSAAHQTIHVLAAPTTLTLAQPAPVRRGQPVTLSATLTSLGNTVGNEQVTLWLGAQSCSPVATNPTTGVATCTINPVSADPGDVPTRATFGGDAPRYTAAPDATGTVIVYDLAPGGGMFVIGDKSAAGPVTFWGAQWWKVNVLTRGAPASFKGFADATAATTCGGSWTTRPGNSTPPPAGQLPAYMAVIVSSAIGRKGSSISGDVRRIVIVKTAPGYAGDPGHAGTGTVAAALCPAG